MARLLLLPAQSHSWRAQSIHWLLTAAEQGCEVSVGELEAGLERLTADRFHDGIGYPRATDASALPTAWLEDQAAILAAMLSVCRATVSERWLELAQRLADVMLDAYTTEQGWLDQPGRGGEVERSWAITDDILPSAVATATDALNELGTLLGDARYARQAHRAASGHLPALHATAQWGGATWRAWFRGAGKSD